MSFEIKVPSVGESVSEGVLARWLKKQGESVKEGEPIFELESDKATQEVTAPATGILNISVKEGTKVLIGAVVGRIDLQKSRSNDNGPAPTPPLAKPVDAPAVPPVTPSSAALPPEAILSPAARQLAADSGVDVTQLRGTGREGRITKEDVQAFVEANQPASGSAPAPTAPSAPSVATATATLAAPPTAPPAPAPTEKRRETRERMTTIRQRIAERLVEAKSKAAILSTFNEVDLSAVMGLRTRFKETFQKKHGVALGFMSFFVKACVEALKTYPIVNARVEGNEIVHPHYYDFGVAVSTERGLMVPVIRDCESKSFATIEKEIASLAVRAREGKIGVPELQGGTFTITNGGIFGSLLSTPILNPPQSGILGMHAIQKRVVVVDDQMVIRPMMYIALSYDHRIIDGREAVSFLVRVKECIESPDRLLLEV